MKKFLLAFILLVPAFMTSVNGQIDCNENFAITLDSNGNGHLLISDLVSNVEFLLTQGAVSYFVFPDRTGTITSAYDTILVDCSSRGYPAYVVEVTDGDDLVENCSGEMIITSPNGGCPNGNPAFCDDPGVTCTSVISSFGYVSSLPDDFYALDFVLCEDELLCSGEYGIAYGEVEDASNLTFTIKVPSDEATQYQNPCVISYVENGDTIFKQSYIYLWEQAECILKSSFVSSIPLGNAGIGLVNEESFITSDETCESVVFSISEVVDLVPGMFSEEISVGCDDLGEKRIWIRNSETGFTISRIVQILDPTEACGTVLGPGDKLIRLSKSPASTFFNHEVTLNGTILPRHPGGIGWIINEANIEEGENRLEFLNDEFTLNGISTLDLVLGLRIILNDEYDSPIEPILFDIDFSNYCGIGDLLKMRRIVLGQDTGLGTPDASFFNINNEFGTDFNPFDFDNTYRSFSFDNSDFEATDFTFEAYKTGDLNETAIPGFKGGEIEESTKRSINSYAVTDMEVEAGDEFTFIIKYESEEKFKGLLAAFIGDGVEFLSLTSTENEVNSNIINGNELRISYLEPNANAVLNEIEFIIKAKTNKSGDLIDLLGLKSGFPQEVVDENNNTVIINDISEIVILSSKIVDGLIDVNIFPNPVLEAVSVSSGNSVINTVTILDLMGRIVGQEKVNGSNISLNLMDLSQGIYMMKINTDRGETVRTIVKQ